MATCFRLRSNPDVHNVHISSHAMPMTRKPDSIAKIIDTIPSECPTNFVRDMDVSAAKKFKVSQMLKTGHENEINHSLKCVY